jgi:hypothetical protein
VYAVRTYLVHGAQSMTSFRISRLTWHHCLKSNLMLQRSLLQACDAASELHTDENSWRHVHQKYDRRAARARATHVSHPKMRATTLNYTWWRAVKIAACLTKRQTRLISAPDQTAKRLQSNHLFDESNRVESSAMHSHSISCMSGLQRQSLYMYIHCYIVIYRN